MHQRSHRKPSVLFVFIGLNRRTLLEKVETGDAPDSAFRGYTELRHDSRFTTDFLDAGNFPKWVPIVFQKYIPATVLYLFHLPKVLRYDAVVASDTLLLGWVASLIGVLIQKARWIYIPINSSVLLRRHAKHPFRLKALTLFWMSFVRIAYISEAQKEDFLRLGIRESSLVYVPYGIDTNFFNVEKSIDEKYVVSVGRDLGRDYPTLLKAAELVPYRIIIATGPQNLPKDMEIPKNIEVLYNVNQEKVRDLYSGATCVLILLQGEDTTLGSDCTGQTVMLEALSGKNAVIATERRWIGEYFVEGKEYLGVQPGDVSGAAEAMRTLWENPSLCTQLGEQGSSKMQRLYSSKAFAAGLAEIITGLTVG
jgi:glycosyltransferase involved in cell wall biosynthesis